jgi:apolipoprotein N-acyltransferase
MISRTAQYLIYLLLVFISAGMLALSFPSLDLSILAWFAVAPFFFVILRSKPWPAFWLAVFFGFIFYTGIFFWVFMLPKYTFLHHLLLGVYLCPLMGTFGLLVCSIARHCSPILGLFSAPFIWVSMEYIRSNLFFLSLPWGLVAHSQYNYPLLIQIASFSGTLGVSFLIILINAAITAILYFLWMRVKLSLPHAETNMSWRGCLAIVSVATVLFSLNLLCGSWMTPGEILGRQYRISVVQANIEQSKKWDKNYAKFILDTYAELTLRASEDKPDLIVWPETATPKAINLDLETALKIGQIAREISAPLLLGSAQQHKFEEKGIRTLSYQNSAFLLQFAKRSMRPQRYDKIRLLPFGEYLPLKDTIPWRSIGIPKIGGYEPGAEFTVFELPDFKFSVTICWENIFAGIVRRFVQDGAQFIVNITNEAWFGQTAAPYQFLSMSVFRAVENRVFVVRCTNTGISCFIDSRGRIIGRVKNGSGKDIFVRGVLTAAVVPLKSTTFYTRHGDWFVWLCAGGLILLLAGARFFKKKMLLL